jgi:hypothetical protein
VAHGLTFRELEELGDDVARFLFGLEALNSASAFDLDDDTPPLPVLERSTDSTSLSGHGVFSSAG